MFDTDRLQRLRAMLSKARDVATAKAAQHTLAGEKAESLTQLRREVRLQEFEETVKDAISTINRLQGRTGGRTKGTAARCTLEEARAYGKEIGLPQKEVDSWFDYFQSNGWKVGGKAPMSCYKSALRNAYRRWKDGGGGETTKAANMRPTDPEGWPEFIQQANYKHLQSTAFAAAPDYLKTEFRQWKRGK